MNCDLSDDGESTFRDTIDGNVVKKPAFDWNMFDNRGDVLKDLRERQEFVDVIIVSEDGGEEIAHFAVLSALGKKFAQIINDAITSSEAQEVCLQNEIVVKKVLLKGVTKVVLKIICDCAYTGFIVTDMQIIWDILETAEAYELRDVISASCTYLIYELNILNCVQLFHLGFKHKHKLATAAWIFIKTHFTKIVEHCFEFPSLSLEKLSHLLDDDELNVSSEKIVWNAIIRWINFDINNRKKNLTTILTKLRFARFEFSFIVDHILTHPFISEDKLFTNVINKFIKEYKTQSKRKDGNGLYVGLTPKTVRPRIPHEVLFAIGGWQEGTPTTLIETYDLRTNRWYDYKLSNHFPRAYHGIEAINGMIYVIGGTNGTDILNTVQCFNPLSKKWFERCNLNEKRCYVSTASIDNIIYAMGGHNGTQRVKSCEKYDPNTNHWERIEDMNMSRSDACAAVHERLIYIAGGLNDQMIENTVEMYNPIDKTWTFIQPMSTPRTSLGFVCYNGSLYAIGGSNGFERLQSVERYDLKLQTWVAVPNMRSRRSTFASCVIEEELFAIGGYNGQTPICLVEKYNDRTNVWSDVKSIRHDRSGLSVCVLKGLSNTIEYTYIGHHCLITNNTTQQLKGTSDEEYTDGEESDQ